MRVGGAPTQREHAPSEFGPARKVRPNALRRPKRALTPRLTGPNTPQSEATGPSTPPSARGIGNVGNLLRRTMQ